ncbi:MAG: CPBP family intramembrane metalloprotease [Bacteroidetes bacterium]|nr:CPBP family intramembrane metalloprotease [Bacteroidota bacterium]
MKEELKQLIKKIKELDRRVVIIFLSVGVLQTISYYYTSRRFFRDNLYHTYFNGDELVNLWEYLYWFCTDFVTFLVLPLFIIKFLIKDKISDYGLKLGDYRLGFALTFVFIFFMLPFLWIVSASPQFAAKYPHLFQAKVNWLVFIVYEIGMFLYMFSWEFIWRGFMLFGLEKKFGYYAILIQMIPFVILHNGKPPLETFSAILGGIVLGILALRTRSFIYGVFVHFGIMVSIDFISALRYRTNEIGTGISALIKVFSELF